MMKSGRSEPDELLDAIEEVGAQAERAGHVMWRLHRLFRKREVKRLVADISEVVREVAEFVLDETNRKGMDLRLELCDAPLRASVAAAQIEQVLLNLSDNAVEAMETLPGRQHELRIQTGRWDDGSIQVTVRDTGPGLPAEDVERIFDPFFTTKPDRAGIGLSINRSIIEDHGGRLWATADPGRGAAFRFTLPADKGESESEE